MLLQPYRIELFYFIGFYMNIRVTFIAEIIFAQFLQLLTHCGRVTQICVFNTVKLGTSASSP